MVIEFKICCLKRCENCSLKSVVEKRVFSIYITKKCVWYHGLNNMFQYSKNIKKKMCLVRVFIFVKKAEQMYEITERRGEMRGG